MGNVIISFFSFFGGLSLPLYCIQEYINTDIMNNPPTSRGGLLNILLFFSIISAGIGLRFFCKKVIGLLEMTWKVVLQKK